MKICGKCTMYMYLSMTNCVCLLPQDLDRQLKVRERQLEQKTKEIKIVDKKNGELGE